MRSSAWRATDLASWQSPRVVVLTGCLHVKYSGCVHRMRCSHSTTTASLVRPTPGAKGSNVTCKNLSDTSLTQMYGIYMPTEQPLTPLNCLANMVCALESVARSFMGFCFFMGDPRSGLAGASPGRGFRVLFLVIGRARVQGSVGLGVKRSTTWETNQS